MGANKPESKIIEWKAVPHRRLLRLIGRLAREHGTTAYLVGGPLRDILLGEKIVDLDIALEDRVATLGRSLSRVLGATFVFYPGFETCTLTRKNGATIDLAQTRTEVYPEPAMLPRVSKADIVSDLRRRDFTVNAMAMDLTTGRFGMLVDPYGGWDDLGRRRVRVLHHDSFVDDPTRVFRALRFSARLGFRIEPQTKTLMDQAVQGKAILRLSGERILRELEVIMKERRKLEIVTQLKPVLRQLGFRLPARFLSTCARLSAAGASPAIMLVFLLNYSSDASRYPLTREMRKSLADLKAFSNIVGDLDKAAQPSEIYRLLGGYSDDALSMLEVLHRPALARKIRAYRNHYARETISIGGDALKRLGIPPGAVYKKILTRILYARLDRKIHTRSDERRLLKKLAGELC